MVFKTKHKKQTGVPIVVQQKQIQLGTMSFRVQSLSLLSGLRIRHCHELWCGSQMQLGSCTAVAVVYAGGYSSLAWEPPYAAGAALEKAKRQIKKKKRKEISLVGL